MAGKPLGLGTRAFDDAKLQTMTEPLTVRIERLKGNTRTPLTLPDNADGTPGSTGWTKEAIQRIDGWIATELPGGGGGLYEVTVTDSTTPNALVMKWQPFFSPGDFPERSPTGEAAASPNVIPFVPSTPVRTMPPQFPPAQFPPQGYYPPMPAPPPVGSPAWGAYRDESERRRQEDELRQLREDRAAREREAIEARHQAAVERERQMNNERFARLENTLTTLTSSLKEMAAPKTESAELVAMRQQFQALQEQARQAEARAEQERREREADRRERELREQIQLAQSRAAEQVAEMNRRFESLLSQMNAQPKNDPLIALLQEQARQTTEAIKEVTRASQASVDRLQTMLMNPRDMLAMARESQAGVEQVSERMSKTFGTILDMQQRVMDNALNLQPQGNGVLDTVRDGLDKVADFAERFVTSKTTEQKIQAQAHVQMAQAQARIAEVQARMTNPTAFEPPAPIVTPPPPPQAQLAGAQPTTQRAQPVRLWGRTDADWFGSALLDDIEKLRMGVKTFLESCEMTPKRISKDGKIEGVYPETVVNIILMAAQQAQQAGLIVPAMVELLMQGHLPEFVQVLLPDANQPYLDEVVKILKSKMMGVEEDEDLDERGDKGNGDKDGGDDDDEDGEDGEDGEGGEDDESARGGRIEAKPSTPVVTTVRRTRSRARA